MTKYTGHLHKMTTEVKDPIRYSLTLKSREVTLVDLPHLNEFIGHKLHLHFTGNINCIN